MKKIVLITMFLSAALFAKVNVAVTYNYLGEITKEVGADNVKVVVLASPKFDPHFIVPKPSLLPKVHNADMLVINGAGLEIGWLPPLLRSANNSHVISGAVGFVDVSRTVDLLDKPLSVSRAFGDVHPQGNPHFSSDPHNIIPIAMLIAKKLQAIDSKNSAKYQSNLESFISKWNSYLAQFDADMQECKTKKVVQYHKLYRYILGRYNIESVGTIEPLPGVSPSSKHTIELIDKMRENDVNIILQDVYHEQKTAKFIASKSNATVRVIPHDIGSVEGTDSLENLYNTIKDRLCH
ncbi:MAG: zinc ABC transporter substrate-binding protein [Sulfurimonas sp.]|nr:zinc ABC transporter substrate-binding protein [Sulfurimonas sp.]